jgi:hypothetical protein
MNRAHLCYEAISALVKGLDAVFRLQTSTQRGKALGNTVRRNVHVSPKGLLELRWGNDLAGVGKQKPKSSQLPRWQMNERFPAKE